MFSSAMIQYVGAWAESVNMPTTSHHLEATSSDVHYNDQQQIKRVDEFIQEITHYESQDNVEHEYDHDLVPSLLHIVASIQEQPHGKKLYKKILILTLLVICRIHDSQIKELHQQQVADSMVYDLLRVITIDRCCSRSFICILRERFLDKALIVRCWLKQLLLSTSASNVSGIPVKTGTDAFSFLETLLEIVRSYKMKDQTIVFDAFQLLRSAFRPNQENVNGPLVPTSSVFDVLVEHEEEVMKDRMVSASMEHSAAEGSGSVVHTEQPVEEQKHKILSVVEELIYVALDELQDSVSQNKKEFELKALLCDLLQQVPLVITLKFDKLQVTLPENSCDVISSVFKQYNNIIVLGEDDSASGATVDETDVIEEEEQEEDEEDNQQTGLIESLCTLTMHWLPLPVFFEDHDDALTECIQQLFKVLNKYFMMNSTSHVAKLVCDVFVNFANHSYRLRELLFHVLCEDSHNDYVSLLMHYLRCNIKDSDIVHQVCFIFANCFCGGVLEMESFAERLMQQPHFCEMVFYGLTLHYKTNKRMAGAVLSLINRLFCYQPLNAQTKFLQITEYSDVGISPAIASRDSAAYGQVFVSFLINKFLVIKFEVQEQNIALIEVTIKTLSNLVKSDLKRNVQLFKNTTYYEAFFSLLRDYRGLCLMNSNLSKEFRLKCSQIVKGVVYLLYCICHEDTCVHHFLHFMQREISNLGRHSCLGSLVDYCNYMTNLFSVNLLAADKMTVLYLLDILNVCLAHPIGHSEMKQVICTASCFSQMHSAILVHVKDREVIAKFLTLLSPHFTRNSGVRGVLQRTCGSNQSSNDSTSFVMMTDLMKLYRTNVSIVLSLLIVLQEWFISDILARFFINDTKRPVWKTMVSTLDYWLKHECEEEAKEIQRSHALEYLLMIMSQCVDKLANPDPNLKISLRQTASLLDEEPLTWNVLLSALKYCNADDVVKKSMHKFLSENRREGKHDIVYVITGIIYGLLSPYNKKESVSVKMNSTSSSADVTHSSSPSFLSRASVTIGDELLRELFYLLQQVIREMDEIAFYGDNYKGIQLVGLQVLKAITVVLEDTSKMVVHSDENMEKGGEVQETQEQESEDDSKENEYVSPIIKSTDSSLVDFANLESKFGWSIDAIVLVGFAKLSLNGDINRSKLPSLKDIMISGAGDFGDYFNKHICSYQDAEEMTLRILSCLAKNTVELHSNESELGGDETDRQILETVRHQLSRFVPTILTRIDVMHNRLTPPQNYSSTFNLINGNVDKETPLKKEFLQRMKSNLEHFMVNLCAKGEKGESSTATTMNQTEELVTNHVKAGDDEVVLKDNSVMLEQEETKEETSVLKKLSKQFICPLTKQLMMDPVLLSDGITYERQAIEQWLQTSDRSPCTQEVLAHKSIVFPNNALKKVIADFKECKEVKGRKRETTRDEREEKRIKRVKSDETDALSVSTFVESEVEDV